MERLEDQIAWYDRKSQHNQLWFKWLKGIVLLMAGLIPFLASIGAPSIWTAILGTLILVLESFQQLNQYQHNWITYRSTCEALKHEKYLYLGLAGPYADASNPHSLLAERVESIVSQENAKWVMAREATKKTLDKLGS
ncbi:DUF4231 domain-containing protein [Thermus sp. SYSU G05001]|uniref:DUF4231 domain-containing protein n=1 Tax=Thermus brevis TaxID=2862456 RepID=A0ABS7A0G0_9DEIN|nr:DUF4231 domain-containing protein [Thermus brevis]MBW6395791.1 DUF4231 domain-containing protein [Thermus brevis]